MTYCPIYISIHAPAWGATVGDVLQLHIPGISIHAPAWGATPYKASVKRVLIISIHAPAWGATVQVVLRQVLDLEFQSTPPRRGRPAARSFGDRVNNFNPRPRVGGDSMRSAWTGKRCHFNPRPRVGGDRTLCRKRFSDCISIHAPAWGATVLAARHLCKHLISIHAPAWGATSVDCEADREAIISIHAPAWGATTTQSSEITRGSNFNPRPRVGGDCEMTKFSHFVQKEFCMLYNFRQKRDVFAVKNRGLQRIFACECAKGKADACDSHFKESMLLLGHTNF